MARGEISYFLAGGQGGGMGGGRSTASTVSAWVEQNYSATTVGQWTVYDLRTDTASAP